MALPLGLCRLAVGQIKVLGFWLALAMVVLDSPLLVYTMADYRLGMVAGLVVLVGLAMVALPVGLLAVLVGGYIQRSHDLAVEQV